VTRSEHGRCASGIGWDVESRETGQREFEARKIGLNPVYDGRPRECRCRKDAYRELVLRCLDGGPDREGSRDWGRERLDSLRSRPIAPR